MLDADHLVRKRSLTGGERERARNRQRNYLQEEVCLATTHQHVVSQQQSNFYGYKVQDSDAEDVQPVASAGKDSRIK